MGKTIGTVLALKDQCTPAIIKIAGWFKKTGETAEQTDERVMNYTQKSGQKIRSYMIN